jgi:hypothetical protein
VDVIVHFLAACQRGVYQILKAKMAKELKFAVLAADMMCEHKHAIL